MVDLCTYLCACPNIQKQNPLAPRNVALYKADCHVMINYKALWIWHLLNLPSFTSLFNRTWYFWKIILTWSNALSRSIAVHWLFFMALDFFKVFRLVDESPWLWSTCAWYNWRYQNRPSSPEWTHARKNWERESA